MDIDWTECPDSGEVPFQQSLAYASAARALGGRLRRGVLHRRGAPAGQVQVMERPGLRLILRGPVLAPGEPSGPWLRRLARWGGATVAVPEAPVCGFGGVPLMTPRHHAFLDLRPDPAVLRAAMGQKWRNRLAAAERRGVEVRPGGRAVLEHLLVEEGAQRQARGYRSLPADFTRALPDAALRLWQWRDRGKVGAAMAFVRHGTAASYHLGWAGPRAREAGAHGAMLWQAALALRAEGVTCLDLGDVNDEDAPGLAHFKLGTGAALRRLGPTLWVLPF